MYDHRRTCRYKLDINQPSELTYGHCNHSDVYVSSQTPHPHPHFQGSFQSANKFLFFPFCHLFLSSISSFHLLTVFLKLQLKDIVSKLTSVWTVTLEGKALKQRAFGKGLRVRAEHGEWGTWRLSEALISDRSMTSPVRSNLNPDIRHWALRSGDQKPDGALSVQSPCCPGKPWSRECEPTGVKGGQR